MRGRGRPVRKPVLVRWQKVSGGRGAEIRIEPADAGRRGDRNTVCCAQLSTACPRGRCLFELDRTVAHLRMPRGAGLIQLRHEQIRAPAPFRILIFALAQMRRKVCEEMMSKMEKAK